MVLAVSETGRFFFYSFGKRKSCNSQKRQNTLEEFAIKKNRFDWLNKFDKIYANAIS